MSLLERLTSLGWELPPVAAPAGAYVPAIRTGDLIFTAGQLPFVDGKLVATGKVGSDVNADDAANAARIAALNALSAASACAGGLDNLAEIVKVVVFVASDPAFTSQPLVANGASDALGAIFESPHARSAVGVAVLPLNSPVEVELVTRVAS